MADAQKRTAAEAEATIVKVGLGPRSYDIVIGEDLLGGCAGLIAAAVPDARCAVVSDTNVAALYLQRLKSGLAANGLYLGEVVVAPGEASKSFPVLAGLCEKLLELGVERGDAVIALGGGVVGDLGGFAASILRRGVRLVQMPTSLLAQVDSSVGGKTGIDTPQGKNLIGAFHQPSLVLADISVLATLPAREFRAGYAEMMKYGLLGDAPFFLWLEETGRTSSPAPAPRGPKPSARAAAPKRRSSRPMSAKRQASARSSISVTPSAMRSRPLPDIPIVFCTARRSPSACARPLVFPSSKVFARRRIPSACRIISMRSDFRRASNRWRGRRRVPARLLELMAQDKKVKGGRLALVLVRGIGEAFLERDVPMDRLQAFLGTECSPGA